MPRWIRRGAEEPKWSAGQLTALTLGRSQFGLHYKLAEPYDVSTKELLLPLPKPFAKDSTVTVGLEITDKKFMELCYEAIDDRNKFLYVRLDPEDSLLYIGTKLVLHQNLHRYDLEVKKDAAAFKNFKSGLHVVQFRWDKASDKLQILLDGENVLKQQVDGNLFSNFANIANGEEYMGDKGTRMRDFRVHEVHFTSPDAAVLTDQNATFYFQPYFHVGAEGSIVFKGLFKPREKKTNEIAVKYEGKEVAGLRGMTKKNPVTITIKFTQDSYSVELEGAEAKPTVVQGKLDKIGMFTISRNMIVQDTAVFTGARK